jgi:hypothetical protein
MPQIHAQEAINVFKTKLLTSPDCSPHTLGRETATTPDFNASCVSDLEEVAIAASMFLQISRILVLLLVFLER